MHTYIFKHHDIKDILLQVSPVSYLYRFILHE